MPSHPHATTQRVIRACERADALHLARQIAALSELRTAAKALALPIAGGIAAFTVPDFGRKLNHVAGAWLEEPLELEQLRDLERRCGERSVALEIDLSPHTPPENLERLARAGYCVNAYTNLYWRGLRSPLEAAAADSGEQASLPQVRRIEPAEGERFVEVSVAGFAAQPKAKPNALLEVLARIALVRQDTVLYVAELEGQWIATAAIALLETEWGVVAHLHLASALPEYRRRGAQSALFHYRLRDASIRGADLASTTTRLGGSARNAERAGLTLACTRPTFARVAS
jgi:GNAT superfamily N-acetyltransferase